MNSIGVYIHIPFCKGKCPYCDFYSVTAEETIMDRYHDALTRAIECYEGKILADTVYFGGGTPSLFGIERISSLLRYIPLTDDAEVTIEANPTSVDLLLLQQLREAGFNRISFGVQSTDDSILKTLGRKHNFSEAQRAINLAKQAGFYHISADLMLAVPNETIEQIKNDIKNLSALPIDHISTYLLKIEEGTPFEKLYSDTDEDKAADSYLAAVEELETHGFCQYEISNFAKDRCSESRHNLKYWRGEGYLGLGPAAHSMIDNKRFFFPRDLERFINLKNPWEIIINDGVANTIEEKIMLSLRLKDGLCSEILAGLTDEARKNIKGFIEQGLATMNGGRFSLTPRGFLVSNHIIGKLI